MITLDGISVAYSGDGMALYPTSLKFFRNDLTVILGPSGAGKSTLLRSLNGLVRPTTGNIRVDGLGELQAGRVMRRHRARTAMIFQQHHLIGRISVLRNVLMGRLGHYSTLRSLLPLPRRDHLLALDCLDKVQLSDKAIQRVDMLSGGQQQRVGLARALTQQPDLILADEPVASLDPETARRALDLLRDVCNKAGIGAIVSLHQVDLARAFADRIIGITHGRVVFDDIPGNLDGRALTRIYGPSTTLKG